MKAKGSANYGPPCRTHGVLCWFTILEHVLENMVRPVQHALKMNIVSVIKQFTDFWRVLVAITIFVRRVAEKTVSGSEFHI